MEVGIWAGDPSGLEVCWGRHALRGSRRTQTYRLQASPSNLTGPQRNSQLGGTVLQIGETARFFFPFESQSSSHNMWTEITRRKYEREGQRYASDLTDAEWALIEPHMPAVKRLG